LDALDPRNAALTTELAALTAAAAAFCAKRNPIATFELSFPSLPHSRCWLVACGFDQAYDYLRSVRFDTADLHWVKNLYAFMHTDASFWEWLGDWHFSGDVWAVPEGTPITAGEPLVRVRAPLAEALLVGPYLRAIIGFETLAATSMARLVAAAEGKLVIDVGLAGAQGPAAAVLAARAAYIAGAAGTSLAEAGRSLAVPVYTTLSHAYIQGFASEDEAFRAYAATFPNNLVLPLDTYDAPAAARRLAALGLPVKYVSLAGGDLGQLARECRAALDKGGLTKTRILAAGDLDEETIAALVRAGAPIDLFAVGAARNASRDLPALDTAYELVEIEESGIKSPRFRGGDGGPTWPGVKQVFRLFAKGGKIDHDTIAVDGETLPGSAMLHPAVKQGELAFDRPGIETIRAYAKRALATLAPGALRATGPGLEPRRSGALVELRERAVAGAGAEVAP